MRASVWTAYGAPEVLQLGEVETPVPKDNEVLIRVHAANVSAGDVGVRSLKFPFFLALPLRVFFGFRRPSRIRVLGQELAGEVAAVGREVTRFKPGDRVFGVTGLGMGAYAEYKCMGEAGSLARMPEGMSYAQAAAISLGGLEALHFLRAGKVGRGQQVLICGAGGSIGTAAVQIAVSLGAQVTAVDSAHKLQTLRDLGAERAIDYAEQDFWTLGDTYDVIFDVIGESSFEGSLRSLKDGGTYLLGNPSTSDRIRRGSGKRIVSQAAEYRAQDLNALREMVEAGQLQAIIDRHYPLAEAAEAHRFVETGRKVGNVIIDVIPTGDG